MNIEQLIQFVQNRIATLERALTEAYTSGNVEQYAQIEKELMESKSTLIKLQEISNG